MTRAVPFGRSTLGFIALTAATINAVSGFLITDRMLKMFKKRGGDAGQPNPGKH